MDIMTEYLTLVISYMLFNFSDFAFNIQSKRDASFIVLGILGLIVILNVVVLLRGLLK